MYGNLYLTFLISSVTLLPILVDVIEQKFSVTKSQVNLHLFVEQIKNNIKPSLTDCIKSRYIQISQLFGQQQNQLQQYQEYDEQFIYYNSSYHTYLKILLEINSKLSNNYLIVQPPFNTIYQVSYQNKEYIQSLDTYYSYIIVQKLTNKDIFDRQFEQQMIQWQLCFIKKIDGYIESLQFDNEKQQFLVHYLKSDGENVFLYYYNIQCPSQFAQVNISSVMDIETHFRNQVTLLSQEFFDSVNQDTRNEKETLPQFDLIIPQKNNRSPISHLFFNKGIILYQCRNSRQSINIIQQSQDKKYVHTNMIYNHQTYESSCRLLHYQITNKQNDGSIKIIYIYLNYIRENDQMYLQCDLYKNYWQNQSNTTLPVLVFESTLINKNVSEFIDYVSDYYKNRIYSENLIQTAYNSYSNKFLFCFMNKILYEIKFEFSSYQTQLFELKVNDIDKLDRDYLIRKLALSDYGRYLFFLINKKSQESYSEVLYLDLQKIDSDPYQSLDLIYLKISLQSSKNLYIKDLQFQESTHSNDINGIILLEKGELIITQHQHISSIIKKAFLVKMLELISGMMYGISFLISLILFRTVSNMLDELEIQDQIQQQLPQVQQQVQLQQQEANFFQQLEEEQNSQNGNDSD